MKFFKYSILVLSLFLIAVGVNAQTSGVKGVVKEQATGDVIPGANIMVEGFPNKGTSTDFDGNFSIALVPGKYKLTFSFVGMENKVIEITIKANEFVDISVPMGTGENTLTEFVIIETISTNTVGAVISEIKEADNVVVGTSAQEIQKSQSNQSSADVARRIPGLTVIDNRFVMVRGLSERYNAVLLNNSLTPSVESDVKSFSFDLIPSQAIDRFMVYKSPSPDLPGEFAGGAIKVYTRNIPDSNSIYGGYTMGFRSETTFQDFALNNKQSSDWLGFGLGNRRFPDGFPTNVRNITDPAQLDALGKSLPNNWAYETVKASPDHRFNIGFDNKFTPRDSTKTWVIGAVNQINYSNSWQYLNSNRLDYNTYDEVTQESDSVFYYIDGISQRQYRFAALSNWGFRNKGNRIDFRNLFNQLSTNETTLREGSNFEEGTDRKEYAFRYNQRSIFSSQLTGSHDFNNDAEGKALDKIDWTVGYSFAKRNDPDWRRIRYTRAIGSTDPFIAYIPFAAQPFYMGRLFLEMNENVIMGAANYEHRFLFKDKDGFIKKFQPTVKAGTYLENKTREFAIRNIGYAPASIFTFDWTLAELSLDSLFLPENINSTTGMKLDEDTKGADSYKAENRLRSYYAMVGLPFTERWNLTGGLRIEDNTQILRSNEITGDTVNAEFHIVRALPSGNISFHIIQDTLLLRAGYGKTLNRPEFRELAPLSFYDFIFNAINTGNPNLETPSIDNFDFRAEWYPNNGEMISAGFFYKKFVNPIEIYFVPGVGSGGTRSFTYDNALSAVSYGIEFDIRKKLADPSDSNFLSRFSIVANASFIKSNVELSEADAQTGVDANRPMMGQSPYIINAGIYYEDPENGWSINLLYNRIGERIVIVGIPGIPEVYEMPRNLLDLTISKNIGKYATIRLSANDIFNNKFVLLQDANGDDKLDAETDQVMQFYRRGSYFTAGFSFRI